MRKLSLSAALQPKHPRAYRGLASLLLGLVMVVGCFIGAGAMSAAAATATIWSADAQPTSTASDTASVLVGTRFKVNRSGAATAIRIYRSSANRGPHVGYLWDSTGKVLSSVNFAATPTSGWVEASLPTRPALRTGTDYVVGYRAPQGRYSYSHDVFSNGKTIVSGDLVAIAGVYTYTGTYPRSTYRGSAYFAEIRFSTDASTPTATPSATKAPTPASAPTKAPATTTPSATKPPAASATPPASSSVGWTVSASTVGLAPLGLSCASLPLYTGPSKVPSGTTISAKRVATMLDVSAGNITIERSCIQPTNVSQGMPVVTTFDYNFIKTGPKVTIRDSEIDGSKLSQKSAAYATGFIGIADMTSNYVHHLGSGIALYHTGTSQSATIERNYVTDMLGYGNPATDGNHSDAFTIRDFNASSTPTRQAIIRNNRFDCDSPNSTGALFLQPYAGRIDNTLIEGNLLEGNGYQLALEQHNNGYSNARAINNRFSGTGFGATYRTGGPGWTQWEQNYLYDKNATNAIGREIKKP